MSDNNKHPLESVAEALLFVKDEVGLNDNCDHSLMEAGYDKIDDALTTLREYIANDERVEGLAEAIDVYELELKDGFNGLKILQAARLQEKRQEG